MSVLINTALSLASSFATIIGMPIIVPNEAENQLVFRNNIEAEICTQLETNDCSFDLRNMPFQSSLTGWSYIANDTVNGYNACIVYLPREESDAYSNSLDILTNYGIEANPDTIGNYDLQVGNEDSQLFKFLTDLSACANNSYTSSNLLIERNYIFSTMMMSFLNPIPEIAYDSNSTVSRKYSYILDSEPMHYATDIGDRINYETLKAYIAGELEKDGCKNVEIIKSANLDMRYINKEPGWVPNCEEDKNKKITITDENLHLFIRGASDDTIIEESKKPNPNYQNIEPIIDNNFKLPSLAGFNGELTAALQYAYDNANKITDINQ